MSTRKRGLGGKKGPDVCFIPSLPDGCCIRMMGLMGDEAAQIRTTRHAPAGCSTSSSSLPVPLPAPAPACRCVPVQGAAQLPLSRPRDWVRVSRIVFPEVGIEGGSARWQGGKHWDGDKSKLISEAGVHRGWCGSWAAGGRLVMTGP